MDLFPLYTYLPLGIFGLCSYYSPYLGRILEQRKIRYNCIKTRSLVLTYDDGPGMALTPLLLDLLASEKVKSTFFLLGFRAEKSPELIDRIVEEGHEVGCHTQKHLNAWKTWPWRTLKDIDDGFATLSPWMASNGIFRPPNGKMSLVTWLSLVRRKTKVGWWTVDAKDSLDVTPSCQGTVDAIKQAGGGVVLLHDYHEKPDRMQFVLHTTELLLRCAKCEGMKIRRLGDIMNPN